MNFVAIDFETANYEKTSACALGLVVVQDNEIVDQKYWRFRPVPFEMVPKFEEMHGISLEELEDEKTFGEVYKSEICKYIESAPMLVAHYAAFDMRVLAITLDYYGIPTPKVPFVCTCEIARLVWPKLRDHKLKTICEACNYKLLQHHNPISDAAASAMILVVAGDFIGNKSIEGIKAALSYKGGNLTDRKMHIDMDEGFKRKGKALSNNITLESLQNASKQTTGNGAVEGCKATCLILGCAIIIGIILTIFTVSTIR